MTETKAMFLLKVGIEPRPRLQVVPEMVDALHRGVTGEAPVTVIAFYAGTEGMPLSK